jgi:hypothetical protein
LEIRNFIYRYFELKFFSSELHSALQHSALSTFFFFPTQRILWR